MLRTVCLAIFAISLAAGQSSSIVESIPSAYRQEAAAIINDKSDADRARLAAAFAKDKQPSKQRFLLSLLDTDPSPKVRKAILDSLGRSMNEEVARVMLRHAETDPDADLAISALEHYRAYEMARLRKILEHRMEMTETTDDPKTKLLFGEEQERWISLVHGTMLPAFLRQPPPEFAVRPAGVPVRVLAFGDYGDGGQEQRNTAAVMLEYNKSHPFDFAITLGDNFYDHGMASPKDPRWAAWWEDLYTPLHIPFYASLGNHDWGFTDSPAAEILYTRDSSSWRMPAPYYTFTAGPVQFFALDTNDMSGAQLIWLDRQLASSKAKWRVVYGHHPIYSAGTHSDNKVLIRRLLPLLRGRVDIYIAGHDHDMQHLKTEDGVHFFVAGGGGAHLREPNPGPRSIFARGVHGFAVLNANEEGIRVDYIGLDQKPMYSYTVTK